MIRIGSPAWANALQAGLGATVSEIDVAAGRHAQLAVFERAGVRVGYADFAAGTDVLDDQYEEAILAVARRQNVDVVRFQASCAVKGSARFARYPLETSLVPDLKVWDERSLEKPRRTANRLGRTEIEVRRGVPGDAPVLHGLYVETMRRHSGLLRYTEPYFASLAESACWLACFEGEIIGFVASARSGDRGFYLHGGHRESARHHYPSDILFLTMLREAKEEGLHSFDFLASPPQQRSLLNYKRAWGGEPHPIVVSDRALGWRGRMFTFAYAGLTRLKRR